jgi:uncharacterized protein (DUF2235 family)
MRDLVLLCDGTNNSLTGRRADTNVVAVAELLARDPDPARLVWYDPGVGNAGELPGATLVDAARRKLDRIAGLAVGRGVFENIAEGYRFLVRHWSPGDRIFLFGFSRGAFTARSIGGLVNQFGILKPEQDTLVTTLVHAYFSERGHEGLAQALASQVRHLVQGRGRGAAESVERVAEQVRELFAADRAAPAMLNFVGVWDTVAAVGLPPFELRFTVAPTLAGKRFVQVRQALALDEQRAQFLPRLYKQDNGAYRTAGGGEGGIEQLWFRGAHADVGGGYPAEAVALAVAPFAWLLSQAVRCGFVLRGADGRLLDDEAEVAERLIALRSPGERLVHSETHASAWWAAAGLASRDTRHVRVDGGEPVPVRTAEHPTVAAWDARFPQATVWRTRRPIGPPLVAAALCVLLFFAIGELLTRPVAMDTGVIDRAAAWFARFGDFAATSLAFLRWQLAGPFAALFGSEPWGEAIGAFVAPRRALLWDFGLIAAYAYVLGWLASGAFARRVGLRRLDQAAPRTLCRLGGALPLMLAADVVENLAGLVAITALGRGAAVIALLPGLVMSAAAWIKLVAFAGVLWLAIGAPGVAGPKPLPPPN